MYTPTHAWCSLHLSKMHAYSPQRMHMHSCMCAYASVQKLLCQESYYELILSFARGSYRLLFATRLPANSTKSVGSHPACPRFTLALGHGPHPRQSSIFAMIFAGLFFAVCCSELLMSNPSLGFCTAAYCSVLQCVAVCCSVLLTQVTTLSRRVSSSVLQRVVACCSALLTIVHFSLGVCVIVYFSVL